MPIAVTEDHESLRATALRWAPDALPGDRAPPGGRDDAGRDRSCRPPGRRWPPRVGSASIWPRSRGGRASRWPSWPSCSRSSGTRSSPGRCCRRCSSRPPWPASAGPAASRRSGARVGRRLHHGRRGAGRHAAPLAPGGRRCPGPRGAVRPVLGLPTARLILVPLDYGTGTGWLVLDREALGSASPSRRSPGLDAHAGRRAADHRRRRPGHARRARTGDGVRRRRARPRPDVGRGRERRDRALVPGDGLGVRQGARPVRPTDRPVPGGEARAGRHAGRRRADGCGGLGRRRRLERGRDDDRPATSHAIAT